MRLTWLIADQIPIHMFQWPFFDTKGHAVSVENMAVWGPD